MAHRGVAARAGAVDNVPRRVILSGCSGGGKSTLLDELARRGHAVVAEPGRRVIAEQQRVGGTALPWADATAFLVEVLALARADHDRAAPAGDIVFFDRGVIDAAAGLDHLTGRADLAALARRYRYDRTVFLVPPWPEIYVTDAERRHGLATAIEEYERLAAVYPALGYHVELLPRVGVAARADIVLAALAADQP